MSLRINDGLRRASLARIFHTLSVDAAAILPQENTMRARKQNRALWREKDPATEGRPHVTSAATSVCLSGSIGARFCHSPDIMLREAL